MHSISPARAMERRARQWAISGLVVVLVGLVLGALGMASIVIPLARAGWYSLLQGLLLIMALGGVVIGVAMAIRGLTFPKDNHAARIMTDLLARGLDDRYTFIRNISRRGLGYLDGILVGPNGALVFYFFTQKGNFYCEGNAWFRQNAREMTPLRANPTREVVKDVSALRDYLGERGLERVPVYAVIVVSYRETVVTAQRPVVPVAHMHNVLTIVADNYLAAERIPAQAVRVTVDALMAGLR